MADAWDTAYIETQALDLSSYAGAEVSLIASARQIWDSTAGWRLEKLKLHESQLKANRAFGIFAQLSSMMY